MKGYLNSLLSDLTRSQFHCHANSRATAVLTHGLKYQELHSETEGKSRWQCQSVMYLLLSVRAAVSIFIKSVLVKRCCAMRLHWWLSWWRIGLQCQRPGFDLWIGKIPWRRKRLPTPVFWPGEFHELSSPWGRKELDTTERLLGEISITPDMQMIPPLWQKVKRN